MVEIFEKSVSRSRITNCDLRHRATLVIGQQFLRRRVEVVVREIAVEDITIGHSCAPSSLCHIRFVRGDLIHIDDFVARERQVCGEVVAEIVNGL